MRRNHAISRAQVAKVLTGKTRMRLLDRLAYIAIEMRMVIFRLILFLQIFAFVSATTSAANANADDETLKLLKPHFQFESRPDFWASAVKTEPADSTHARLQHRAQAWLDQIHEKLKSNNLLHRGIQAAPIAVIKTTVRPGSSGIQGSVSTHNVCIQLNKPIKRDDDSVEGTSTTFSFIDGSVNFLGECDSRIQITPQKEVRLVQSLHMRTSCRLIEKDQFYTLDQKKCFANLPVHKQVAREIVFTQTEPIIAIDPNTFLALKSEEEFVAFLAHETAHYYLAHPLRRYNEFYLASQREPFSGIQKLDSLDIIELGLTANRLREISFFFSEGENAWRERKGSASEWSHFSKVIARANQLGLAKYSHELEADEVSLLILKLLGVPLESALKLMEHFILNGDAAHIGSVEQCHQMLARLERPNFGSFLADHPSGCFRTFNHLWSIRALTGGPSQIEHGLTLMTLREWQMLTQNLN